MQYYNLPPLNTFSRLVLVKGYTFIEMMVVISLFTVVMLVLNQGIFDFYRQNEYTIQQSAAIQNAREGVEEMVRDLREAVVSQGGAYPIESASVDEIIFYSDIDRDQFVEKARYYIDSDNQLVKEATEILFDSAGKPVSPAQYATSPATTYVVAKHIVNDMFATNLFTYFDENGNEIIDLADQDAIRFIEVNLVVNVDPNRAPEEFNLRSSAYLRNLKPTLQ